MGSEVEDFVSNPLEGVVNLTTNVATGGLVGYKDGKLQAGVVGSKAVDGLKEVTGANAAEDANRMAREQFEKQTEDALKDKANAKIQNQNANISASQGLGAARNISTKNSRSTPKAEIGDVTDFLGI